VLSVGLAAPVLVFAQGLAVQRTAIERLYPQVRWINTQTVARWLEGPEASRPVLLDAREADEYTVSHLAGARRIDPDTTSFDDLNLRPGARIVVYCSVGWRSGAVADRLREAGYTDAYNLEGGIFKWANEDRELRRAGPSRGASESADKVHPYDAVWGRMLDSDRRAPLP